MTFALRPFTACVEALRASELEATLNSVTSGKLEHWDSAEAHSFDTIGEWSSSPPLSVLYRQNNPVGPSAKILKDPRAFVEYCNFGGAVATWNANGTGRWKHGSEWIVVEVELVQEQADHDGEDGCGGFEDEGSGGDCVDVVFALWKVEEGWAAAVWSPQGSETLAKIMGFDPWSQTAPGDWQSCTVWYGE